MSSIIAQCHTNAITAHNIVYTVVICYPGNRVVFAPILFSLLGIRMASCS